MIVGATVSVAALAVALPLMLIDGDTATNADRQTNPLHDARLYVDPESDAAQQAEQWQATRQADATAMRALAEQPMAIWLTSEGSLDDKLMAALRKSNEAGTVPVLVAYDIQDRDCGLYSAGGAKNVTEYRRFIDKMADMIGDDRVVVILEPDAVANLVARKSGECLDADGRQDQYRSLSYASQRLGGLKHADVYIDAGHSGWVKDKPVLAEALERAGIGQTSGFSLNVSNFRPTDETVEYGRELSRLADDSHFVIDTSRNGNGVYVNRKFPDHGWCNPPGRALGHYPTTKTGEPSVDAYLYIKTPGESDGQDPDKRKCFDGPKAGQWWPEYALGLVQRWPQRLQPAEPEL